jgi:hypothetical protein
MSNETKATEATPEEVMVCGVRYTKAPPPPPSGRRAVVVVDRGWIFAGDVTEHALNGVSRIILTRSVWVFRWEGVGFDGVLANPKQPKVQLRKLDHAVDIPLDSEIFRVPVADDWGL